MDAFMAVIGQLPQLIPVWPIKKFGPSNNATKREAMDETETTERTDLRWWVLSGIAIGAAVTILFLLVIAHR